MERRRSRDARWDETVQHPVAGRLEAWGRRVLYSLAGAALPAGVPPDFSLKKARRVLLIKEPYRMGDLMQITPSLRAVKQEIPSVFLGLVIQDRNLPVFEDNPHVDRLFIYRKRRFTRRPWEWLGFLREIRSAHFEIAVTLETERTHLTNDLIALFSGAPVRARYDGMDLGNPSSNAFYNLRVPRPMETHEVDRNFGVLKALGLEMRGRGLEFKVPGPEKAAARNTADAAILESGGRPGSPFLLIHPGSYKLNNRWPLERFLEAGSRIRSSGGTILFLLGPSEEEWGPSIRREGFAVLSGIPLREMAALLSIADQVLCNDTGVMHIAAGVGARTLALFGETDPERWKPPGGHVAALRSPDRNVASIGVEEIVSRLSGRGPPVR